ncbi:hypothetical protein CASFOL_001938 [Castilleja foliolosa]|uniref:Inhibitor I9 domain-containing protein n=1 Tax=Castilleja foliolosa TaxID=1961234 RepID=A0ABD3ED90_9LAMI
MAISTIHILCTFLLIISPLLVSPSSIDGAGQTKSFIIRVNHDAKPSISPTHNNWYDSTLRSISTAAIDGDSSGSDGASRIIHSYATVFHGFSARLSASEAEKLESVSGIMAVIPEQVRQLHTTRSPEFLGLKTGDNAGLLRESDFGSDLVIGVIDTGIWPERASFNDLDLSPVPAKWKGECVA